MQQRATTSNNHERTGKKTMSNATSTNTFADEMATHEVPQAPEERRYDGPPRIYWQNGVKSTNPNKVPHAPGQFWISERELGGFTPGAPWEFTTRTFDDNKTEDGYAGERVRLIILARRSQPFRNIKEGSKVVGREWHDKWYREGVALPPGIKGPSESIYTEFLVLPEGFYDPENINAPAYPCVWAVKGMGGMAADNIVGEYDKGLLKAANDIASEKKGKPVRLPRWAFAIPVGAAMDAGQPRFQTNGFGGVFQPPALLLPAEIDAAVINEYYVGADRLAWGAEVYAEYEEWRTTVRVNEPQAASKPDAPIDDPYERDPDMTGRIRRYVIARNSLIGSGITRDQIDEAQAKWVGTTDAVQSLSKADQEKVVQYIEEWVTEVNSGIEF